MKVTYRQSLKFRRRERKEYPLIHRILLESDTKDIFLEVEVKRKFSAQYKGKLIHKNCHEFNLDRLSYSELLLN